jgi:hypothetical protein
MSPDLWSISGKCPFSCYGNPGFPSYTEQAGPPVQDKDMEDIGSKLIQTSHGICPKGLKKL